MCFMGLILVPEGTWWTYVDEVERVSLALRDQDACYYYLVHTPGGFEESEANSRIANFKKDPVKWKNTPSWYYKGRSIEQFSEDIASFLLAPGLVPLLQSQNDIAIAPMPTSKPRNHPSFDNRLELLCESVAKKVPGIRLENPFDLPKEITAAHLGGSRMIGYLEQQIEFKGFQNLPAVLFLVDDVLTTGAHFVACSRLVEARHPQIKIIGLFLARHRQQQPRIQFAVQKP